MSSAKWHTFCLSLNEITCLNLLYPGHLTFVSVVKWVFVVEFYGFHTSIVSDEATSSKVFSFPRTIASCSINDIRGIKAALKCLPRLLNSLCPVAMESQWDMRHGLQLVVVSCFMIGWYKCWWGACAELWVDCNALLVHMIGANFHHFSKATASPLAQPQRQANDCH